MFSCDTPLIVFLFTMSTPSQEQNKRSAADIFVAFEYQWDYFVLMLLKSLDQSTTISFELHDDVGEQSDHRLILYQVKHSVQKNARGETKSLSNRDIDLWKTISIWMKLIEEQSDFLENTEFQLVTNKKISENAFIKAIENFKITHSIEDLRSAIVEIQASKRSKGDASGVSGSKKSRIDVSKIISDLLNKPYLVDFIGKISVSTTSDILKEDIKELMYSRFALNRNRIDWVYNNLMSSLKDNAIDNILAGKSVSFTGTIFAEQYQSILDIGRKKLHFRTDYSYRDFEGNPRELLFIKQLFAVNDTQEDDTDRIAALTTSWLRFHNNFHDHWDDNTLISYDIDKLTQDVCSAWRTFHHSAHRNIPPNPRQEDLYEAGCNTVDKLREKDFKLADASLGSEVSEGCIYYYSNSSTAIIPELPLIGWHLDWENKFKKK